MSATPNDPRNVSRRNVLIAGAAGAGAALAAGLPRTAQAATRAVTASAAARKPIVPGIVVNPVQGPPTASSFELSQDWNFGKNGNIPDITTMNTLFQYHDQFGQYNNGGGQYGADTVAPDRATALPNQPIQDPSNPVRTFTKDSLKTHLVPLYGATTVVASAHNIGCGSFVAQYTLPNGGALLGQHLMWETRVRYVTPPYFWFAIWTSGNEWDDGAEMDMIESFGYDNGPGNTNYAGHYWHSDSAGGVDGIGFADWQATMAAEGITNYDASEYHVWQWYYFTDDSYVVMVDGIVVQNGSIHWTLSGTPVSEGGTPINMTFLFDGAWGSTVVSSVDHSLPASELEGKYYEWDYSRIYLSNPSKTGWSSAAEALGGETSYAPAVSSRGAGKLDVFAVGSDNGLRHLAYEKGAWGEWEYLAGSLTTAPAAVSMTKSRIDVFGVGTDGTLQTITYENGAWGGWTSLGGDLTSAPAVTTWGDGRLDVFARGTDDTLWQLTYDSSTGGWGSWASIGGMTINSDPAAVAYGPGHIDIVALGSDSAVWEQSYDSSTGWAGWTSIGGTAGSAPAICSWSIRRLDVFVCDTSNDVQHQTFNCSWGGFGVENPGVTFTSAPSAVCWSIGRIDIVGQGSDGGVWHQWWS